MGLLVLGVYFELLQFPFLVVPTASRARRFCLPPKKKKVLVCFSLGFFCVVVYLGGFLKFVLFVCSVLNTLQALFLLNIPVS